MQTEDRIWRERGLREAVLSGDERAWQVWYDESYGSLYSYVLWRSGGLRDHADELVQEVWLVAVKRLSSFDPTTGSFAAWLRGIAAGLARNHFRRSRRKWFLPVLKHETSADTPLLQRERAEQVARTLAELPDSYEAVLRAKYLEELDVATIAQQRGVSVKAIESMLSRAREAFRNCYNPEA